MFFPRELLSGPVALKRPRNFAADPTSLNLRYGSEQLMSMYLSLSSSDVFPKATTVVKRDYLEIFAFFGDTY